MESSENGFRDLAVSDSGRQQDRVIQQSIQVRLDYKVVFANDIFDPRQKHLVSLVQGDMGKPKKIIAILDQSVAQHHPDLVRKIRAYCGQHRAVLNLCADPLVLPGGEDIKNSPELIGRVHELIHQHGLCRHSYVMAIGGGALLDLIGFAAATAHRGIRLIRVPTTVLAQNDSGVGVKNGINYFGKKNFLGTFATPYAVLNDSSFLTSLSDRDWRSGLAEAVKVSLIRDANFFETIRNSANDLVLRNLDVMNHIIYHCARLHMQHISQGGDPFELGSSRPLDFGHWSAHKLEKLTAHRLRHGEAVAIGLALDSCYSQLLGLLTRQDCLRILDTLRLLGFQLWDEALISHLDDPAHPESIFAGLTEFREHLGGLLTLMMLRGIGSGCEIHDVDVPLMRKAIAMLRLQSG